MYLLSKLKNTKLLDKPLADQNIFHLVIDKMDNFIDPIGYDILIITIHSIIPIEEIKEHLSFNFIYGPLYNDYKTSIVICDQEYDQIPRILEKLNPDIQYTKYLYIPDKITLPRHICF